MYQIKQELGYLDQNIERIMQENEKLKEENKKLEEERIKLKQMQTVNDVIIKDLLKQKEKLTEENEIDRRVNEIIMQRNRNSYERPRGNGGQATRRYRPYNRNHYHRRDNQNDAIIKCIEQAATAILSTMQQMMYRPPPPPPPLAFYWMPPGYYSAPFNQSSQVLPLRYY